VPAASDTAPESEERAPASDEPDGSVRSGRPTIDERREPVKGNAGPIGRSDGGGGGGPGRALLGPRLVGGALIALGAVLLIQSFEIGQTRGFSPVGPSVFAIVTSLGLLALGAAFLLRQTLRPDTKYAGEVATEEQATDWRTIALAATVLVAYAILLGPLGYIVATGLFLPVGARILGSERPLRDLVIGLVLAAVVWFGFTQFLGVRLPAGLLDPVLPGG
jgi:putative tricarboxylic transport membrane protein